MIYIVMDVETYWADDYTLTKLTTEEYVRHPDFKVHGWGVLPIGGKPHWLTEAQFLRWSKGVDWSQVAIICHNTRFDGAILSWKYGIKPRLWIDTMGMMRALHPYLARFGLGALGKHFGFGTKGNETVNTKNKRNLTPAEWAALGTYCASAHDSDCNITLRLFQSGWDSFTPFERAVMDMTLRMYLEPVFVVDRPPLEKFLTAHIADKQRLLDECGVTDKKMLMSNDKFASLLRALDVDPPTKPSPSNPAKQIYAFAKTDEGMTYLQEHDDPRVQVLASARLGNKSTILETRTRRVIDIGSRGPLPIPLNYWGALVTGRHSGGDKINMQNFTRGSELRNGLRAPPGYKIVVGDSSNIELRLVMVLAGQHDQVALIRHYDAIPEDQRITDLYCDFATKIYNRVITKKDKDERFVGKTGMLSLQYMASGERFWHMLRQKKIKATVEEADRIKSIYRRLHRKVEAMWYYCDETVIPAIAAGNIMCPVDVNGWFLTNGTGFALPGELGVQYHDLKRVVNVKTGQEEWSYISRGGRRGLYGAKVVENQCQHAARQVVMYQGLLVKTRYPVIHSVHDELVSCVPEDQAEECAAFMLQCLSTAPPWAGDKLPVTGEVGIGDSYGEAK